MIRDIVNTPMISSLHKRRYFTDWAYVVFEIILCAVEAVANYRCHIVISHRHLSMIRVDTTFLDSSPYLYTVGGYGLIVIDPSSSFSCRSLRLKYLCADFLEMNIDVRIIISPPSYGCSYLAYPRVYTCV